MNGIIHGEILPLLEEYGPMTWEDIYRKIREHNPSDTIFASIVFLDCEKLVFNKILRWDPRSRLYAFR